MRVLIVGMFGLAIVFASTPVSKVFGSGGSAMAFAAGKSGNYNAQGQRLSTFENRQRIQARDKTKSKKGQ